MKLKSRSEVHYSYEVTKNGIVDTKVLCGRCYKGLELSPYKADVTCERCLRALESEGE